LLLLHRLLLCVPLQLYHTPAKPDTVPLLPQRTLFVSQLARKHPVAFFQFLDRCARSADQLQSGVFEVVHLAQLAANGSARIGTKGLADLLSSPAATAALGSALCSILKLTAVYTANEAGAAAAAAVGAGLRNITGQTGGSGGDLSSTRLFAALEMLPSLGQLSSVLMAAVQHAVQVQATPEAAAAGGGASSSSNSSNSSRRAEQARASSIFLMVLLCQRLLALHDAAADIPGMPTAVLSRDKAEQPAEVDSIDDDLVCNFMADALAVLSPLRVLERGFWVEGVEPAADGAATAQTAAPNTQGSQSSSSSSSSSRTVRWQHLLRLHESRKLMAAVTALRWAPGHIVPLIVSDALRVSSREQMHLRQMYQDAMDVCRSLVAVAPLPVVCNNPQCKALHRVSDAAAARYVCAGCGCRYCSAACQAAGWRSHKKACRRMAACGLKA
jgi:hypothetical protein